MIKQLLPIILLFGGIFLSHWLFNHVNPWVGIIGYILIASVLVEGTIKNIKK
jgi:hypothetical protein